MNTKDRGLTNYLQKCLRSSNVLFSSAYPIGTHSTKFFFPEGSSLSWTKRASLSSVAYALRPTSPLHSEPAGPCSIVADGLPRGSAMGQAGPGRGPGCPSVVYCLYQQAHSAARTVLSPGPPGPTHPPAPGRGGAQRTWREKNHSVIYHDRRKEKSLRGSAASFIRSFMLSL